MEKTLSFGTFTELDRKDLVSINGGAGWLYTLLGPSSSAAAAEKRANEAYENNRNDIINLIYQNNGDTSQLSQFSMNYWNISEALSGGTNISKHKYLG